MSRRRYWLGLALCQAVLPVSHAAEAEIYVTTGPDGIEMFSNLPRGTAMQAGLAGLPLKNRAVVVSSTVQGYQSRRAAKAAEVPETSSGPEILASGKSFLLDD